MANPTPCKTWFISPNLANPLLGFLSRDQKYVFWSMHQALLGLVGNIPVGIWTVVQSATATTLSAAGVNLMTTYDLWQRPGTSLGPYSWLLLQRSDGVQMCLSITIDSSWCEFSIDVSPSGLFTGGTAGVPPTATDNVNAMRNGAGAGHQIYGNTGTADFQYYQHVWQSSDGTQTRVLVQSGPSTGTPHMYLAIDVPQAPDPSWVKPLVVTYQDAGNSQLAPNTILSRNNPSRWFDNAYSSGYQPGVGVFTMFGAVMSAGGSYVINNWAAPNSMSNAYYLAHTAMFSNTAGAHGPLGEIPDFWWNGGPDGHASASMGVYSDGTTSVLVADNATLPWPQGVTLAGLPLSVGPFFGPPCATTACTCGPDNCDTPTTSLITMRNGAKELADKVDDASVSDATWNLWINQGIEDLWKRIVQATGDAFLSTYDFTLGGGIGGNTFDVTTIPAKDFRRLRMLEVDPTLSRRRRIKPFNLAEKDRGGGRPSPVMRTWDSERRYRRMGNLIYVERYENAAGNYRLYYEPKTSTLEMTCDALPDVLDEWAEYPQVFAAMKALGKEESDPGYLPTRIGELRDDIAALKGEPDDDADASTIADVEDDGDGWNWP